MRAMPAAVKNGVDESGTMHMKKVNESAARRLFLSFPPRNSTFSRCASPRKRSPSFGT